VWGVQSLPFGPAQLLRLRRLSRCEVSHQARARRKCRLGSNECCIVDKVVRLGTCICRDRINHKQTIFLSINLSSGCIPTRAHESSCVSSSPVLFVQKSSSTRASIFYPPELETLQGIVVALARQADLRTITVLDCDNERALGLSGGLGLLRGTGLIPGTCATSSVV
jgi:hypothetical protein